MSTYSEEQLHSAGNKLTYKHIYFKNQVMKVNFAVQSVGKSPKYGREVLKLPQFAGSEATEEHCY